MRKKLYIYLVILTVLGFVYANIEHRYLKQGIFILSIILVILILRTFWKIYRIKIRRSFIKTFSKLSKFIRLKTQPMIKKLRKILHLDGKRFIKGKDSKEIIFNFGLINKIRKTLNIKKKIDIDEAEENKEKIKLLYIKFILQLIKQGLEFKSSLTPSEINDTVSDNNTNYDSLINLYESVRYDKSISISNDIIAECENIIKS